ncbi:flagellar basal-body MS-ring/collar protein FliF [Arcobacter porcinus]|uniref:Flagellar M-ring protein n=1 Tax=Arcobacter porcinus TaxID=1935204 RepID=A0A5C2HAK8_9BACT|nr:flagellar basal-body MS-ring/collar protein FliF [Arcobacter porcinus]OCL82929.1 Flagellar M-ring protein [Arcobacter porcinus]OCL84442.1 Flagellar M-ring protein [Arcobacter porcinus]OCL89550.1 Flagellar M-ring protein [Aliarcobacter thereius]QEP39996.1 flagellar inner membrane MS-ring protein FliF [Arcobacter porcinus]
MLEQITKFINNLNKVQKIAVFGGIGLLAAIIIGFLLFTTLKSEDKKLNFIIASNLTQADVMRATEELESAGIEFIVTGSGSNLTLKTSQEFVNIAKIKLVTSEASTNKHVGWEIFEKSTIGTTNFENKVKYLRALEGELSKSLEALSSVLKANVKIAIPKETIFTEKKADTTASAVITLKQGLYLTQKQIDGIKNFIASAVSELKVENIQLIDSDGNLLELNADDINNQRSTIQTKYKEKFEEDYEKKIITLLEPVVGYGRVVAKVNVNLDFVRKDIEEEIFAPQGTVRSQQVIESSNSATGMPDEIEVVGVDNNIQPPQVANEGNKISSEAESSNTVTNYEISRKLISQKDANFTNIRRVTASVSFDSMVLKDHPNKEEFLASLESLVEDAIGYDKNRGDKVSVKDFKFVGLKSYNENGELVDEFGNIISSGSKNYLSASNIKEVLDEYKDYIQYLIVGLILFIFYRRFVSNSELVILGEGKKEELTVDDDDLVKDMLAGLENELDQNTAQGRLKTKVKSQILNNIDGLDEESAAKYEVFIEELDREINNNPADIARMIELLLSEGNVNFK